MRKIAIIVLLLATKMVRYY